MLEPSESEELVSPMTKEQAAEVRKANPPLDIWRVVKWQAVLLVILSVTVHVVLQKLSTTASLVWGGMSSLVPGVVFARMISFQSKGLQHAGLALASMAKWELVKIVLTVLMLLLSPKVVPELSWLALVAGFVITMKVYWLACYWMIKSSKSIDGI